MQDNPRRWLVWRVRYDTRFSSSAGMTPYHTEHKDLTGYVVTRGNSLTDVENSIRASLDNQTALTALHCAEYLGTTL